MTGTYDSRLARLECGVVLVDNGKIADNILVGDALLPEFHFKLNSNCDIIANKMYYLP